MEQLINEYQLDILGLNETRLHTDIHDQEVSDEGFEIHRYDRDTSGCGVTIYVNNTLSHHRRDDTVDPNLEIATR